MFFPVRYADDFVILDLRKAGKPRYQKNELAKYLRAALGLELSPEKTRERLDGRLRVPRIIGFDYVGIDRSGIRRGLRSQSRNGGPPPQGEETHRTGTEFLCPCPVNSRSQSHPPRLGELLPLLHQCKPVLVSLDWYVGDRCGVGCGKSTPRLEHAKSRAIARKYPPAGVKVGV